MIHRRHFLSALGAAIAGSALGQEAPTRFPARAVTAGPKHHFFGYYDKCPWDRTGRYLLAMEIGFHDRQPKPGEELTVGMVDLRDKDRYVPFADTPAWCWQQGTMLQWLGSAPEKQVVYNAVDDGRYVALVRDVHAGRVVTTLPRPIYALSNDGKQAVSLPFDRLHRLRPGYGYCALPELYPEDPAPKKDGIWWMDMASGKNELVVPIAKLAAHMPDRRFAGAHHWVNHLQFNPSGSRFLFLHRWRVFEKPWMTRLYTCKPDGTDLRLSWDTGMVSHFDWRDDDTILAWVKTKDQGNRFVLIDVNGGESTVVGGDVLTQDGHCSYSPDRKWILNDTYPDKKRMQWLMLCNVKTGRRYDLNQFHLPPKLTGPFRCDLHPRWNRDGTQVCIDSAHEPTRQVYVVDVREVVGS
jgi:hypothetical protein